MILELKNISKSFPGVKALQNVNFDLQSGEIHCIVGGNGAGKSTLIKVLSGVYAPDEGEIVFGGDRRYSRLMPHISRELGIQTIYQETMLAPTLTVAENIFLGDSLLTRKGRVDWRAMREKAKDVLDRLEVDIPVGGRVSHLGIAGKQAVQIAKALVNDAKVMIFDEPTASFGRKEVENLFRIMRMLKENGVGIIYISHRLEEVFEIADRISVFKDGKSVSRHENAQVDFDTLIQEMVGRSTQQFYSRERVPVGETVLRADHITGDGAQDISFELKRGEILGIGGMVGAKRTELLKCLYGAGHLESGTVTFGGETFRPSSPTQMLKKGMCMVTEDRAVTGLLLGRNVKENMLICKYSKMRHPFLSMKEEARIAEDEIGKMDIKASSYKQLIKNLSGGNQQKVILAKWLLAQGEVFLMDEPTRGVDIAAKEDIYKLMVEIVRRGGSVILVSSDMPELVSMSDRILVMKDGKAAGELLMDEISEKNILKMVVGG